MRMQSVVGQEVAGGYSPTMLLASLVKQVLYYHGLYLFNDRAPTAITPSSNTPPCPFVLNSIAFPMHVVLLRCRRLRNKNIPFDPILPP